ncbi:MAG: FHA domain-containing protein [Anaerolineaceae bacterium]|nr:FHA domain-containing protein [Anaerolineaceae bacterium]
MSGILVFILRLILVASLYAFLTWAIYTLWRTLHLSSSEIVDSQAPEITLSMDDPEETRQSFTNTEVTIGRESSCDFTIPNDVVSSHHARLRFSQKQWWIEDLQSTNGTFLNNERIYTPTVIMSGEELMLGKIKIQINIKT